MRVIQDLNSHWEFCQAGSPQWRPAQVPGHVHLDLYRNGVIANPCTLAHEAGLQWVDDADWTYRTTFTVDHEALGPGVALHFEGLDTIAEIHLNGAKIGESDNMFVPLEIPVHEHLHAGANDLEIRFKSAVKVGLARREEYFQENDLNPEVAAFDERAFVRKAPYMSGWDWGPRLVSCGIWKPILLVEKEAEEPVIQATPVAAPVAELRRVADAQGKSFEFYRNGEKVWIRGANWIPDTSFPSELRSDWLRKLLDAYVKAGINMLRVWGGGLYESDLFYELCAERNILVWQDFIFACSYYPESPAFLASVEAEARAAITRLRKHPNLVLWCGNNECHTMWDAPWHKGAERPTRFFGEVIYEKLLPALVQELDPGRPYIPSSPIGGKKANDDGTGDNHYWEVWHGRGDWRFYEDSRSRFASEFGFASAPCEKTWTEAIGAADCAADAPLVRHHDKTLKPWETFRTMVELHYPPSESLTDWIYYSQLSQRDAMRAALEHYRRSEECSGTLIWQANDCWPVQSWSLWDSEARPKAAAYELARIHNDLLISLHRQKDKIRIYGINDGTAHFTGTLQVSAHCLRTGEICRTLETAASIAPGQRIELETIELSGLNTSETLIWAQIGPHSAWSLLTEPKLARFAAPAQIEARRLDGAIELCLDSPVVDLMLTEEGDPSPFLKNFITQPSSGKLLIPVQGSIQKMAARSLSGRHSVIWF